MRFAPIKSAEQQSVLMLHRTCELLVCQKTTLINALRGDCGELGIIVAQGASKVAELIEMIENPGDARLPALAREALMALVAQLRMVQTQIIGLEKQSALLARRPSNVVLVAMANKTARVLWAVLSRVETYRAQSQTAA